MSEGEGGRDYKGAAGVWDDLILFEKTLTLAQAKVSAGYLIILSADMGRGHGNHKTGFFHSAHVRPFPYAGYC